MIEQVIRLVQGDPNDLLLRQQIVSLLDEMKKSCPFRIQYRIEPIRTSPDGIVCQHSGLVLEGALAASMLKTCHEIILVLCTLGYPFEQKLAYYQHKDVRLALLWDACGSLYIEKKLDEFENSLPYPYKTDRFSCGYGDLPLSLQPQIVASLPDLGVRVLPSHMMFPTKSVSALIGIGTQPQPARIRGCAYCSFHERCAYKERGETCGI